MPCNCGKKNANPIYKTVSSPKKQKGTAGSRIKKIWKLTESRSVVVKKVDNK